MEETTLPSASFVLNGLKEQFDAVLRSIDAFSVKNAESQKQLNADFLALKKAQNTAKQAEMINTKQLKKVISVLTDLEEEVNRKQKIDQTLHEKNRIISAVGDKNIQDLKELLSLMAQACTRSLSSAEAGKISLQRLFVFSAAFGGVFVILLSFLSLFGIRYPLSRLIENAREMAHGDRSVLIHFTERDDEVGALAKALAALLIRLKGTPQMPNELLGRQGMTFGSDIAYKTLSLGGDGQNEAQQTSGGEEFAYFGQGVGIDTESQLCQMLFLVQQICTSATEMTQNIKQKFSVCRECLETIRNVSENMKEKTVLIGREITENDLSVLQKTVDTLIDSFSECFSEAGEMRSLQIKQDASVEELVAQIKKMQLFLPRLTEWGRVAGELIGMIHSLSSETKILALNASIEAAKAGEKAKSFGSVSLDMRHRTHKTTEIAEQLRTQLVSIREDIMRFAEAMNNAGFRIDELYQCSRSIQPLQNGQTEHIHNSFALSESVKNMIALHIGKQNQVLSQLVDFPENAGQIALTGATVRLQTDEAEQKLEEFISSLPTYEEDKEQKIQ